MQLGKNGFMKQIVIYLSQNDNQQAYDTGKEFVLTFGDDMISHFLLAKAAFALAKYDESAIEARKAFNLTDELNDMLTCAILAGTAYFEMKEYAKGLELLDQMAKAKTSEDLEELRFIFALALEKGDVAAKYLDALYGMNRISAERLLMKFM